MIQRVIAVMNEKAVSATSFAKEIGIKQTTFNNYIRGIRPVGIDVVLGILSKYVDISSDWLLLGKGEMHVSDNLTPMTGNETETQLLEAANETLREKIKGLEKTILLQESLIKEKDKRLAMMEGLLYGSHEDYIEEKRKSV
jgi:plasmid maintenance system antidote protein VapI